jgi:hypothetical protein
MRTTLTRALVIAAAIVALAASPALARPGGPASASAAAAQERQQDLQHLAAGNSIRGHQQDLGPVFAAPAPGPAPVSHPAARASGPSDNSDPWLVIALGVGGLCVVTAGALVVTNSLRANPRAT